MSRPSSLSRRLYLWGGSILLGGYATLLALGVELGSPQSERMSDAARRNPRGVQTWYSGYRGGK